MRKRKRHGGRRGNRGAPNPGSRRAKKLRVLEQRREDRIALAEEVALARFVGMRVDDQRSPRDRALHNRDLREAIKAKGQS